MAFKVNLKKKDIRGKEEQELCVKNCKRMEIKSNCEISLKCKNE